MTRQRICDAALKLIAKRGGADITLAQVAQAARVSRQALYLHFADRAGLLVALVRHADERRGLPDAIRQLNEAASGVEALRVMAKMQATLNPGIWPLARLFDSVRRQDAGAERSWQDRLAHRLQGCQRIIARLREEGTLKEGLDPTFAADVLWSLTSLRNWEDLVLVRGWTAEQYEQRLTSLMMATLVQTRPTADASRLTV